MSKSKVFTDATSFTPNDVGATIVVSTNKKWWQFWKPRYRRATITSVTEDISATVERRKLFLERLTSMGVCVPPEADQ